MRISKFPSDVGMKAAYKKHLPLALSLSPEELPRGRGDAVRARYNLYAGIEALRPHRAKLEELWRPERVEALYADLDLGDSLVYAALAVQHADDGELTLAADIATAYELRDLLLSSLELAVKFRLIPGDKVASIRVGHGSMDAALDLIAAVEEFRRHREALHNKTPVTEELLQKAELLGNDLVARITPVDQKASKSKVNSERSIARDIALRFYALVAKKHKEARRAAAEIWNRNVISEHVPPLQAKAVSGVGSGDADGPGGELGDETGSEADAMLLSVASDGGGEG